MKGIGSLLLALSLGASAQQVPDEREVQKNLKALAAAKDEASREAAFKFFDEIPLNRLFSVEASASREGAEAQAAVHRWLPHRAWTMVLLRSKIGEARRREAELVGPGGKVRPGDFAKGVALLLEKEDPASRRTALRLFAQARPPDPSKLVPFLSSPDPELVQSAAMALAPLGDPAIAREILKTFKSAPPETAQRMAFAVAQAAGPDWTPELVELLKSDPDRMRATAQVLMSVADARAEPALIGLIERLEKNDLYGLIRTLSLIGGADSAAAIRKYRDGLPEGDRQREECLHALIRLRAPGVAREILSQSRAGVIKFEHYDDRLVSLGDRSVVPDLAAWAKDKELKLETREKAIELLGVLGDAAQLPLLLECLGDERLEDSAAKALGELGDPAAARPLAEALKQSESGHEVSRALMLLPTPLKEVDEPLLEILNDPEGHDSVVDDAVRVAARCGSPKLKAKLLELLTAKAKGFYGRERAAWEILPLLQPGDRETLAMGRASSDREIRAACTTALAALGDAEGVKEFVKRAQGRDLADRDDFENNIFLKFPSPPEGLLEAVEAAFRADPKWFEGAEFLAHLGKREGLELLKEQAKGTREWSAKRAGRALLILGDRSAVPELARKYEAFHFDPEEEAVLAAAVDEEAAARLREVAWSHLRTNHPAGRVLARRADKAMEPLFRSVVRSEYGDNEVSVQMNDGEMALALAKLGARDMQPLFLRWLRSDAATRRALAARCLAILGDRASVHGIAPLLDDLEPVRPEDDERDVPVRRVREAAADALEVFSGGKFAGLPAARAAAARAWYERGRDSFR